MNMFSGKKRELVQAYVSAREACTNAEYDKKRKLDSITLEYVTKGYCVTTARLKAKSRPEFIGLEKKHLNLRHAANLAYSEIVLNGINYYPKD